MTEQAPANWYPVEDGRLRYWDGAAWTEHFAPGPEAQQAQAQQAHTTAVSAAAKAVVRIDTDDDPDAIWRATGKPLTGIGGGRYKLTRQYLFFEKGVLSTNAQQVPVANIFDVDVRQSMAQKARGVGSITLHVQRPQGREAVTLEDIANFREGQHAINDAAHASRLAIQQLQNTHTYQNGAPHHLQQQAAATSAEATSDPIVRLRQLGELRDAGILTDEEFAAKKAEILSRM